MSRSESVVNEAAGSQAERWVLQFCHGYDGPFLDCARQYAALFVGTPYKVCTVYLTGKPSAAVEQGSASDEVIFLDYTSRDVRGLKLKAIRDFKCIAASRDFKFCIAHRFKPIYVALLGSDLPVIGVHHAFGDYRRRTRQLFANFFRKRLALLGVSNAVRDDMRACLPNWPAERIETLYNRIDIAAVQAEQVSREAAREHLGLPQDAWVIGNVGRLHPDKDQATLIRGFALALPNLPAGSLLAIMGSGRLEAPLKALVSELGVDASVRFLGQVADGRNYFKAFDVFVLTSDHEPFGMVLLEAMAAGVPVIASDCGGAPEVVGSFGSLFPLQDEQALAGALQDGVGKKVDERVWGSLHSRFSDETAKRLFSQLPMVASGLRGGGMKLLQILRDSQCRRWLRQRGIKFSPSLRNIKKGAELVLEEGVVLRNVQMGFRNLKIGAMTYMRGDGELWNVSQIGRFCSIGNGVVIGHDRAGHPLDWVSTHPFSHSGTHLKYSSSFEPAKVGHDVWIGRDAMILEGVEVGTGAVIAARSVVTKDVPPYAIVAGSPAKIVRYRHSEEIINGLLESHWWTLSVEQLIGLPVDNPALFLEQMPVIEPPRNAYASVRLTSSCWQVSDSSK